MVAEGLKRARADSLPAPVLSSRACTPSSCCSRGAATEPSLLPPDYLDTGPGQARKIADYIAGMTDRYAMREHKRLFVIDET